ncbi:MAG: tRNA (cytosine(32)/uridine(32)-2'-O)-methyltransferase TrmJ [Granulosicoccaceae bacterium]|jgi:tRNA (cytidine32/uridine32-2'-O)-methyltransferase
MLPRMLDRIRIVLVETSHPGNIGAAARALKNMGLRRLELVRPAQFPDPEAFARASGAADILEAAGVHDSLDAALQGCSLVYGASARLRSLPWPQVTPRECAAGVREARAEVALVFGRERTGLTNAELERCDRLVHIPCNPDYSSLNVAAAVQVLCYEMRMATQGQEVVTAQVGDSPLATREDLEGLYRHLEETLIAIDFLDPASPRQLMRRLRRLFNRAGLEQTELNILRGILKAVKKQVKT